MIERTSDEERARRRAICEACPHVRLLGRKKFMQCSKCLCPLGTKTMFQRAKCPAGKW